MGKVRAWVAQFIADYMVVQVLSSAPAAYLAGWAFQGALGFGRESMEFDSLPALFWPILCVLLLLITGYHGWISPIVRKRGQWREDFKKDVNRAFICISQVRRPEILNPEHTGNPAAIQHDAENAADVVRDRILKIRRWRSRGLHSLKAIDVQNVESIEEWHAALREVRRIIA